MTSQNRRVIGFSIPKDNDIKIIYDVEKLRKSADFKIAIQNAVVFHWFAKHLLNRMVSSLEQYKSE